MAISLPSANTYFNNTNSTGPVPLPIGLIPDLLYEYNCTSNSSLLTGSPSPPDSPYVALTATINGVGYPLDSSGNLLRPQSGAASVGYCPVGINNRTDTVPPSVILGLPFLRSVYVYVSGFALLSRPSHKSRHPARIVSQRATVQGTTGLPFRRGPTEHSRRFRKHRRQHRPTVRNACLSLHLPRRQWPT